MRRIALALAMLIAACAEDPLQSQLDELEDRVACLESEQEAQREALLERVDGIPLTAENASEISDIRAKLSQTTVSSADFLRLQSRVARLEGIMQDWSSTVSRANRAVFAVLHGVFLENGETEFTFVGTAFAVDGQILVTNGHVVEALQSLNQQVAAFNRRYGTALEAEWLVVQNQTTSLRYKYNYYFIEYYWLHPDWNPRDVSSVDVGAMQVTEGTMYRTVDLASTTDILRLRVGAPICTIGFPGELQGGFLSDLYPIATFKDGTVSALRPHDQGESYSIRDAYIMQHNLDLSGGTSGSPILNTEGEVVAINNAGIESLVVTFGGAPARVSQAALGFGIRADKILELLTIMEADAKPVARPAQPLAPRILDGRAVSSLRSAEYGSDLDARLAAALGL